MSTKYTLREEVIDITSNCEDLELARAVWGALVASGAAQPVADEHFTEDSFPEYMFAATHLVSCPYVPNHVLDAVRNAALAFEQDQG